MKIMNVEEFNKQNIFGIGQENTMFARYFVGILVEAYSPIAHGELLKNQKVAAIAKKYGIQYHSFVFDMICN